MSFGKSEQAIELSSAAPPLPLVLHWTKGRGSDTRHDDRGSHGVKGEGWYMTKTAATSLPTTTAPSLSACTSRQAPAIKRAIARLRVLGHSKSAIGRELGIDRQTVTRSLRDPVTQAEMRKLEHPTPPQTAPLSLLDRPQAAPALAAPCYKVPLDIVPMEARRLTYLQLRAGEVFRETLNLVLLAAVEEYIEAGTPDVPPEPAPAQPKFLSAQEERRREEFLSRMNGVPDRGGSRASGRRVVSSVPPWLRPQPNLDW